MLLQPELIHTLPYEQHTSIGLGILSEHFLAESTADVYVSNPIRLAPKKSDTSHFAFNAE